MAKKRTPSKAASKQAIGFTEPITMKHQTGTLGVLEVINLYNRLAAEMKECAATTAEQNGKLRTDIAYFNY